MSPEKKASFLPSPGVPMFAFAVLAACGQFVPAGEALSSTGSTPAVVELTNRDALAAATHLGHYALDGLLATHTGEVRWGGGEARGLAWAELEDGPEARLALTDTLANLASVDPAILETQAEQLAFWLNLYHAWTMQAVLDARAADASFVSVADDGFALFDIGFVRVGGVSLSLNQVEHGVLRGDPAAMDSHFANQAAVREASALWQGDLPDGLHRHHCARWDVRTLARVHGRPRPWMPTSTPRPDGAPTIRGRGPDRRASASCFVGSKKTSRAAMGACAPSSTGIEPAGRRGSISPTPSPTTGP